MNSRELASSICSRLEQHGYRAFLVGGCVRDLLLGREPADYDVTTDATPDRVRELFPGSIAVGARFGVILVERSGGRVEVATFRRDLGYSDGRHPDQVAFSREPSEDVARRDFTINGLLMHHRTGEVLDFVGGRTDLEAHLVRAIGDPATRFAEDKLRMLRCVRFAARFGYAIDPETFSALENAAGEIHSVSAERIREELTKLLTEGAARRGFELLDRSGLLRALLPEISAEKGVPQPPEYHPEGDVWVHTLLILAALPAGVSPTLAWGALLHDVGKPPTYRFARKTGDRIRFDGHDEVGERMARELCSRLKFSTADSEQIGALVATHMKFKDVELMRPATLKRFVRLPRFAEHLELHRLDCLASHGRLDAYTFVKEFLARTPAEAVRPQRLLTGEDLTHMGYVPGPDFQVILRAVEDAQLEGRIETRDDALRLVRKEYPLKP